MLVLLIARLVLARAITQGLAGKDAPDEVYYLVAFGLSAFLFIWFRSRPNRAAEKMARGRQR